MADSGRELDQEWGAIDARLGTREETTATKQGSDEMVGRLPADSSTFAGDSLQKPKDQIDRNNQRTL